MSNALARLRRVLGDPLLVRRGAALVPTARAEALAGPVREALTLIRGAIDAPAAFDPARDRRSFRVSCSDYSVLMLIGPLVRGLAADAPGVAVEVVPRLPDAGRALDRGEVDLVIEPPEIMGGATCRARGSGATRGCAACGTATPASATASTSTRYTRLGHLIYSMGAAGQPVALPDLHLARLGVQRRIEVSVESFLLAPFLLQGTDLVTLVPARAEEFLRRTGAIRDPPAADRVPGGRGDAVVAPAGRGGPRPRVAARADAPGRAVTACRGWRFASRARRPRMGRGPGDVQPPRRPAPRRRGGGTGHGTTSSRPCVTRPSAT